MNGRVGMKRKLLVLRLDVPVLDSWLLEYWQSLASSLNLVGWSLEDCVSTLHNDITSSWNFYDPENVCLLYNNLHLD